MTDRSTPMNKTWWRATLLCALLAFCTVAGATGVDLDLLDYHGTPGSSNDRSLNIFFDAGAWHGYSLPPEADHGSGFVGPFIHSLGKGQWVGDLVGRITLRDVGHDRDLVLTLVSSNAAPGYMQRVFAGDDVRLVQTLFYPDSWHAVIRNEISAAGSRQIALTSSAQVLLAARSKITYQDDHVLQKFPGTHTTLSSRLVAEGYTGSASETSANSYRLRLDRPLQVRADQSALVYFEQTLLGNAEAEHPPAVDYAGAWPANRQRWAGYLASAQNAHLQGLAQQDAQRIAAKAIVTLIGNWRAARGDLLHDGVVPSYSDPNYNGFWAWDSWKHVAALATFAPALAQSQLLAMFDYQSASGMIPDCIFMQKSDDNFRDSKPPLAGWAALHLFRASGDREFLEQIYEKLVRYHRWWYAERDHDHNGLAEYGSTDGSLIAAAWESGMDNAVRFDSTTMLRNGPNAWSADQESVDLNAYLYDEKRALAEIAAILGKTADQLQWLDQAQKLKGQIQEQLFDSSAGYFFDRKLVDGKFVSAVGPEGWIPLWAGAASEQQAQQVAKVMLDQKKFATFMPFPSLAADDAHFDPVTGYWRGAVWIDQAYFAIAGLRRYGFDQEANALAYRLVSNAKGLRAQTPFHEVYDPLTGTGLHAPNFSWSAAHFLLLLSQ